MNFDQSILYFFNQLIANPALDTTMRIATVWGLWLPLALIAGALLNGRKRLGAILFLTLLGSFLLTFLFYYLALRPRPVDVRLILPTPNFPSFPSGHATMAFGCATAWFLATERKLFHFLLAYLTAAVIAVSRLYLGHHYPSDVAAGAILGTSIGVAVYGIVTTKGPWIQRIRWLLWPQIAIVILVTMMAYLNVLPIHLLRFPYADKVLHFLLFGAVTFWLQLWLPNRKVGIKIGIGDYKIPLSILVPFAIALIEEGFQHFSPIRTASLVDLGADAAGMIFFYLMAQKLLIQNRENRCPPRVE